MKPRNPVRGIIATNVVVKAVTIINNAFLILCLIDSLLSCASSKIIICESIPVPIAAIIPAIEGRSKFQPIREAVPRIIRTSDSETVTSARDAFIFLYLTNTTIETAMIAKSPANKSCLVNWSPRFGEIWSIFTISSLKGREPVIRIVCSCFISAFADSIASSRVVPLPDPEIEICVVTEPFRDVPMFRDDVNLLSMKKSSFLLR